MDMVLEVFKTNVLEEAIAHQIIKDLEEIIPCVKVNFDLEDCDKILRIESLFEVNQLVKSCVNVHGYCCEELEG